MIKNPIKCLNIYIFNFIQICTLCTTHKMLFTNKQKNIPLTFFESGQVLDTLQGGSVGQLRTVESTVMQLKTVQCTAR